MCSHCFPPCLYSGSVLAQTLRKLQEKLLQNKIKHLPFSSCVSLPLSSFTNSSPCHTAWRQNCFQGLWGSEGSRVSYWITNKPTTCLYKSIYNSYSDKEDDSGSTACGSFCYWVIQPIRAERWGGVWSAIGSKVDWFEILVRKTSLMCNESELEERTWKILRQQKNVMWQQWKKTSCDLRCHQFEHKIKKKTCLSFLIECLHIWFPWICFCLYCSQR